MLIADVTSTVESTVRWRWLLRTTREIESEGGYLSKHPPSTNLQSCSLNNISGSKRRGDNPVRWTRQDGSWMPG